MMETFLKMMETFLKETPQANWKIPQPTIGPEPFDAANATPCVVQAKAGMPTLPDPSFRVCRPATELHPFQSLIARGVIHGKWRCGNHFAAVVRILVEIDDGQ